MCLSVLNGFTSGEAPIHTTESDPRFTGLSQSEMLERLDEERQGCPMTLKSATRDGIRSIGGFGTVGELEVPAEEPDFRDSLDEAESACG